MGSTIVTYIYPGAEIYFNNFISAINNNYLKDIDICIFNDKANFTQQPFNSLKFPYQIINMDGTLNEIRYKSFEILKTVASDNIIFQDIDDLFSRNRFKVAENNLQKYDLVCNDLKFMTDNHIDSKPFWKKRLGNYFEFDYSFIMNKNIVGLGNTAIKKKLLYVETYFSNLPIAFDWFYFYQILKLSDCKALFTSEAQTYYLQHNSNIAGIKKESDKERLAHIYEVKRRHYNSLISKGFKELKPNLNNLKNNFHQEDINYFWWEELN